MRTLAALATLAHALALLVAAAPAQAQQGGVFRPVTPCRLIDTRGFPAALSIPGPLAPGSNTNVNAAGQCGIPASGAVLGLSLSISILNQTPSAGGYVATQQQGAPVSGINTVLSSNLDWIGTTAAVPIPDGSGNFAVFVANSRVHLAIDVQGYFEAAATGGALSNAAAAVHVATAANSCTGSAGGTVVDHPQLNGDPNALLFVTKRANRSGFVSAQTQSIEVFYQTGGCGAGHWLIGTSELNGFTPGTAFNLLIVKP